MASYEVNAIATEIRSITTKLQAMHSDADLPGGHPDQDSPGHATFRNTEWRESLQKERRMLIQQLCELGYSLDSDGNPVSNTFDIVTEVTT